MNQIVLFLRSLPTRQIIFLILCICLIVYGNALFNGFLGDDHIGLANPSIQSITNIPMLLSQGNIHDESGQINNFYRPVTSIVTAVIYFLFGLNPFGYHLFTILTHAVNTIFLF